MRASIRREGMSKAWLLRSLWVGWKGSIVAMPEDRVPTHLISPLNTGRTG
jgi:hypothetical protein